MALILIISIHLFIYLQCILNHTAQCV